MLYLFNRYIIGYTCGFDYVYVGIELTDCSVKGRSVDYNSEHSYESVGTGICNCYGETVSLDYGEDFKYCHGYISPLKLRIGIQDIRS